jgi:N-acetylglucosamine malate deacetylase 1
MSKKQSILALGAHPDDIEIGMGGTVAKLVGMGYEVYPVICTLPDYTKIDKKEHRKSEAMMSSKVLRTRPPAFLDLPPDELQFSRRFVALLD